jgi:hypothetical protein
MFCHSKGGHKVGRPYEITSGFLSSRPSGIPVTENLSTMVFPMKSMNLWWVPDGSCEFSQKLIH